MFASSSRRFASSAIASVKVPIALHGIEGRYATALFTAASKKKALETVESDLKVISSVIAKDAKVQSFLDSPLVDRASKKIGVSALLSKGKYSEITKNLFQVLAENGRLDQSSKIISSFHQLLAAGRGEVHVSVTSAKELEHKVLSKLRDTLAKSSLIPAGSKLLLTNKVDPEILGGLVVDLGDKTIDLSAASKLAKLNRIIAEPV